MYLQASKARARFICNEVSIRQIAIRRAPFGMWANATAPAKKSHIASRSPSNRLTVQLPHSCYWVACCLLNLLNMMCKIHEVNSAVMKEG